MADAWPGSLPQSFLAGSFREQIAERTIRTQMDVGPALVRKRSSAAVIPIAGAMVMTATQLATFKTFVNTTIDGGAETFTFPDPHDGSDLTVRLTAMPAISDLSNDLFRVGLDLEVLP